MLKIEAVDYQGFDDPRQVDLVKKIVALTWPVLPEWVNEVFVAGPFHRSSQTSVAATRAEAQYARTCIYLSPEFFAMNAREQVDFFLHEMCHVHNAPVRDSIRDFQPDGNQTEGAINRWLEFSNSHLTSVMWKLLGLEEKWQQLLEPTPLTTAESETP